jgi:transitional endoplasmic reticulum ATPase
MAFALVVVLLLAFGFVLFAIALLLWRTVVAQRTKLAEPLTPARAAAGPPPSSDESSAIPKAAARSKVERPDASGLEVTKPEELETFASVGGLEVVKAELRTAMRLLFDTSGLAAQYDIDWNGVLLHGAPGVGKTLMARACAGEMNVGFIYVSTADVVSKWIGAGPGRVDAAFEFAKRHTPCILFFDEFDSIAANRGDEQHVEYRRLTNQLLASLEEHREERGLVVMAATNAYEELDPAVIRPGRFDRHIEIPLPDLEARLAIFRVHLHSRPLADDVDLDALALATEGWTGARIEALCDAAALECAAEATRISRLVPITQDRLLAEF